MKRQKPANADFYAWAKFERWANLNGIGTHEDDWIMWWMCWKAGYCAAMNTPS